MCLGQALCLGRAPARKVGLNDRSLQSWKRCHCFLEVMGQLILLRVALVFLLCISICVPRRIKFQGDRLMSFLPSENIECSVMGNFVEPHAKRALAFIILISGPEHFEHPNIEGFVDLWV